MGTVVSVYRRKLPKKRRDDCWPETLMGYKLIVHKPNLFTISKYGGTFLKGTYLYLITFGRLFIFNLYDGDNLVHYQYIMEKSYRFPFMSKNDIISGHSETSPKYRRKGIFLNFRILIIECLGDKYNYIWSTSANIFSIKTFEKSGYMFYSKGEFNKYSKILNLINEK